MLTLRQLRRALRTLMHRDVSDRDLDREIDAHIALEIDRHVARGLPIDEARALAARDFGRVDHVRDELRDIHSLGLSGATDAVRMDGRIAVRSLLRTPAFTVGVVATLAIGVAASATMFGLVDRLLLRPPEYVVDPERVGRVYLAKPGAEANGPEQDMSYYRYTQLADAVRGRAELAATFATPIVVGRGLDAQRAAGMLVTPNFFPLLGVHARRGRFFLDVEGLPPNGANVAVLGYGFWKRVYAGSDSVIGRTLQCGALSFTIVGVAPAGFTGVDLDRVDVFLPTTAIRTIVKFMPPNWPRDHNTSWAQVVGRRAKNVSAHELDTLLTRAYVSSLAAAAVKNADHGRAMFGPLQQDRGPTPSEGSRIAIWLTAVSAILLLVACSNVANLLLARALRRHREVAIRVALGVTRRRLLGQLLSESILLAGVAGVVAVVVTVWTGRAASAILLPNADGASVVDGRVMAMTLSISMLIGVLTGLAPALQTIRPDVAMALKAGARAGVYQRMRLRFVLLAAQAAFSLVLLVAAGLFVRSLYNVRTADIGFDPDHTLLIDTDRGGELLNGGSRLLYDRLEERARTLPFVTHVSRAGSVPFAFSYHSYFSVPGIDSASTRGDFYPSAVEPDYFATMGTRIIAGRGFTTEDRAGTPLVTVVSEGMTRLFWPGATALGRCIRIGGDTMPCSTVVGVVEDVRRFGLRPEATMAYYTADAQRQPNPGASGLVLRVSGSPILLVEKVRQELQRVAPGTVYVRVRTFSELVAPSVRPWRLGAIVFGIFGAVALAIGATGLYGVIAFGAAQRIHEVGVRIALGAPSRRVVATILGEGMKASTAGLLVGTLLTLAGGHWLAPLLFGVSPNDPLVLVIVIATLACAALLAGLVPAIRATRIDPATALRSD